MKTNLSRFYHGFPLTSGLQSLALLRKSLLTTCLSPIFVVMGTVVMLIFSREDCFGNRSLWNKFLVVVYSLPFGLILFLWDFLFHSWSRSLFLFDWDLWNHSALLFGQISILLGQELFSCFFDQSLPSGGSVRFLLLNPFLIFRLLVNHLSCFFLHLDKFLLECRESLLIHGFFRSHRFRLRLFFRCLLLFHLSLVALNFGDVHERAVLLRHNMLQHTRCLLVHQSEYVTDISRGFDRLARRNCVHEHFIASLIYPEDFYGALGGVAYFEVGLLFGLGGGAVVFLWVNFALIIVLSDSGCCDGCDCGCCDGCDGWLWGLFLWWRVLDNLFH